MVGAKDNGDYMYVREQLVGFFEQVLLVFQAPRSLVNQQAKELETSEHCTQRSQNFAIGLCEDEQAFHLEQLDGFNRHKIGREGW